MKVKLSAQYNPHLKQVKTVESLEQASKICQKFIRDTEISGELWTGGQVWNNEGNRIAYVSYNGKIWEKGSQYYR